MGERITVSLSAVKVQHFAGSPRATMTGEAEFSDGNRLRFRYRPAHDTKAERVDLFTMRHGTGVTSSHHERVTMEAARETFNARRADESPLWAFVQRVAHIGANSNSDPDTMGAALDLLKADAADLLTGRPGLSPFFVILRAEDQLDPVYYQVRAADQTEAVREAWRLLTAEYADAAGVPDFYYVVNVFLGEVGFALEHGFDSVAEALED